MAAVLIGIVTLAVFLWLLKHFPLFRYTVLALVVAAGAGLWWLWRAKEADLASFPVRADAPQAFSSGTMPALKPGQARRNLDGTVDGVTREGMQWKFTPDKPVH